jgi:ABC-type uncharacterized transport system ATPase subunit
MAPRFDGLHRIPAPRDRGSGDRPIAGSGAVVSGDRAAEGVFRQWSVERNLSVSALGVLSHFGWIARVAERSLVETWRDVLPVRGQLEGGITSLSGGTQQKVLVGRALADAPDVLLLDDPTRGVIDETKLTPTRSRIFPHLSYSRHVLGILWEGSRNISGRVQPPRYQKRPSSTVASDRQTRFE